MPVQRLHLTDIDHEMERNFLNLSELKSNKRRRSDNRSCSMGNMVKTMSVIHTHRKTSNHKDASSSRPTKSSRLSKRNTSGFSKAASPGLDSSTAYDPSTSPTYYHTSSSAETGSRAKKQRNCSPLPAWLANTFNSLVRNHPLRLLLPGNPSPPPSPTPALRRLLPPSPPSTVHHSASRPSHIPQKDRHKSQNLSSTRHAAKSRKAHRPKEEKIFAFDPFDGSDVENALGAPERVHEPAPDFTLESACRVDSYARDFSDSWLEPGEWHLEKRQPRSDNGDQTRVQRETVPNEPSREYTPPEFAAPSTPIGSIPNSLPFGNEDQRQRDGSPSVWQHSLVSVPRYSPPIGETGHPGPQYIGQLYKTRGPASTIEVPAPCLRQIYFDCPTEDPLSSPSSPTRISIPVLCSKVSNSAISPHVSPPGPFHPPLIQPIPFITPISKPFISDANLDFTWKKVDLNGIHAPSASNKRPIYKLPSSDDDNYTEISSVLPSLLAQPDAPSGGQVFANDLSERKELRNTYETPAPTLNDPKATYAPGPRLVRGSQSSNRSTSERPLRIPTQGALLQTLDSPAFALTRSNTPVTRPNYVPPTQTALNRPAVPADGLQAPPTTPVCQVDAIKRGSQADIEVGAEDILPALPRTEDNTRSKTPKSSAVFAPAPGIYISPLRGSDTSKEEKKTEGTTEPGSSQESNDSIQSWSDR